eukprot:jgi/Chrzof1/14921/Cz09g20220.t1
MWIKRDDLTGMQLSGNKVRKLEFLLADAKAQGADCVITIGGIQSNHCRATAVAARYLGLDCHLILRTSRQVVGQTVGLVGNLLVERMAGAVVHKVTKEEYTSTGSEALSQQLLQQLQAEGRRPYLIPVGGSNSLGTWGYLNATEELLDQSEQLGCKFTDIVMACGSGGTTAGLALGNHLSGYGAKIWAYGVCDDPQYFFDYIDGLYAGLGWSDKHSSMPTAQDTLTAVQAKGIGYAISNEEELKTTVDVAAHTGIVLDPVYSGKAVHYLLKDLQANSKDWQGRKLLFIHTGGLLGMYDKVDQLQPLVHSLGREQRMVVS